MAALATICADSDRPTVVRIADSGTENTPLAHRTNRAISATRALPCRQRFLRDRESRAAGVVQTLLTDASVWLLRADHGAEDPGRRDELRVEPTAKDQVGLFG